MASKGQFTGMVGVYLAAAELSKLQLIASPTSRSAYGADILVTDRSCHRTWSVQVKTNASTFGHFIVGKAAKEMVAKSHVYIFVNLKRNVTEFFIVPSKVVANRMRTGTASTGSVWHVLSVKEIAKYRDCWEVFAANRSQKVGVTGLCTSLSGSRKRSRS
jgi:hypothetical protein